MRGKKRVRDRGKEGGGNEKEDEGGMKVVFNL